MTILVSISLETDTVCYKIFPNTVWFSSVCYASLRERLTPYT